MIRNITALTPVDFGKFPIWEHDVESGGIDLAKAVEQWPVTGLNLRFIGVRGSTRNAGDLWLQVSGIDCENSLKTEHLMSVSIWSGKSWILLPRYHDVHFSEKCYDKAASDLGSKREDVFPIKFSLFGLVDSSDPKIINQTIDVVPNDRRLDQQAIIQLCMS